MQQRLGLAVAVLVVVRLEVVVVGFPPHCVEGPLSTRSSSCKIL